MFRYFILIAYFGLSFTLFAADQVRVLCYHTFLGRPKVYTDFSMSEFRHHVSVIKQKGYRFVTLSEVLHRSVKGSRNVMLVLDDGNVSALHAYEQVLKPLGIHAVFAVYPGIISKVHYAMRWDDVLSLKKSGNDVVSHGYFHEYLNAKLQDTRPKDFLNEVVKSKKVLEEKLGTPVVTYVYPFGVVTDVGRRALAEHQYRYAFSLVQKPMALPIEKNPDLLNLPRYMLTRSNAATILKEL